MSTKRTAAHGPRYHLYEEVFDEEGSLYLELTSPEFQLIVERQMGPTGPAEETTKLIVRLPKEIWRAIERHGRLTPIQRLAAVYK